MQQACCDGDIEYERLIDPVVHQFIAQHHNSGLPTDI